MLSYNCGRFARCFVIMYLMLTAFTYCVVMVRDVFVMEMKNGKLTAWPSFFISYNVTQCIHLFVL